METARNVVNLFDDGRQPREISAEETDAQVYILTDPHRRHTQGYALPEYRQKPDAPYDAELDDYYTALHDLIEPFTQYTETDAIRVQLLAYAKQLETHGIPYGDIVACVEFTAERYWAIINGDITIESTDTI